MAKSFIMLATTPACTPQQACEINEFILNYVGLRFFDVDYINNRIYNLIPVNTTFTNEDATQIRNAIENQINKELLEEVLIFNVGEDNKTLDNLIEYFQKFM